MDAAIPPRHLRRCDARLARALRQYVSDGDDIRGVTARLRDHALRNRQQRCAYLGRGKDIALTLGAG